MSPGYTDQPRFLTPLGQSRTGFATLQKVIGALEGDIRARAQPATLALLHAADGVEDHAANAPGAVTKVKESAERLVALAACELMVAAQAIDLKNGMELGPQRLASSDSCAAMSKSSRRTAQAAPMSRAWRRRSGPAGWPETFRPGPRSALGGRSRSITESVNTCNRADPRSCTLCRWRDVRATT